MIKLAVDIGYSTVKVVYDNKLYKFPTAISYAIDTGINYGEDDVYEFEGQKYRVGEIAVDESFTTTNYQFLYDNAPLIIFHVLKKLNILQNDKIPEIELRTGLALVDFSHKEEFEERIRNINVNNTQLTINNITIIPQGAGVHYDYISTKNNNEQLSSDCVIDIGYNTINFLVFNNGIPVKPKCKAFPGHGVTSIVRPFTNWLEATFGDKFTEQEAIKYLLEKEFIYGGEERPEVAAMINELTANFVNKLFKSILVSEKKILSTSKKVIMAGGGAYFLKDIPLPKNVDFVLEPYEFSNVRGYYL